LIDFEQFEFRGSIFNHFYRYINEEISVVCFALSLLITSFEEACEEETEFKIIKKENRFDHFVFDHFRKRARKIEQEI
jgi:hypothetical protein